MIVNRVPSPCSVLIKLSKLFGDGQEKPTHFWSQSHRSVTQAILDKIYLPCRSFPSDVLGGIPWGLPIVY